MATIKLTIASPERMVYENDIAMLIVRSTGGELGILPKHAPLVTGLIPYPIRVKLPGSQEEQLIAVSGGFMEVTPDEITILASAAEEAGKIDVNRAQAAYKRAKDRIASFHQGGGENKESIDVKRAELALQRAISRLKTCNIEVN